MSVTVDLELMIEYIFFYLVLDSCMNLVKLCICFQIALLVQSSHYVVVHIFRFTN